MTEVVINSEYTLPINETISNGRILNGEYVNCAFTVLAEVTLDEYLDFCKEHGVFQFVQPNIYFRVDLKYYRVRILD